MKVDGTFMRMQTLADMTRAALKIWQFVAQYTTNPLLCQGVDGDIAMAKNTRRVFADVSSPVTKGVEARTHIAFDDKYKLITPDKAALYVPPVPRAQVVALANWEAAPTFVLDDHLGKDFPKASTDRLLNKCNPFLSGKRRALSDDISSEAPTVSTDCSTFPEIEDEDQDLDVVEEEECGEMQQTATQPEFAVVDQVENSQATDPEPAVSKQPPRWVSVGHGRYVKHNSAQNLNICSNQKTETSWTVRWVQVGYGRYEKFYANGDKLEKAVHKQTKALVT